MGTEQARLQTVQEGTDDGTPTLRQNLALAVSVSRLPRARQDQVRLALSSLYAAGVDDLHEELQRLVTAAAREEEEGRADRPGQSEDGEAAGESTQNGRH